MLCLRSFPVTKTVWIRGEGESIKTFRGQIFGLQWRKFLWGNPSVLCFRNFPVANNLMNKRGGESIKIFRRKFCLTVSKKIVGESFSVS